MSWGKVGDWLKDNGGQGVALIGSLLTGNVPGAIAAGVSMVSGATGVDDPQKALEKLQADPSTVVELRRIAHEEEKSIREHIATMERLRLEDAQKSHEQTQLTIRNGDNQESKIRWVRPIHATLSLIAGIAYIFLIDSPDATITTLLFTLPWTYAGLREVGKGINSFAGRKSAAETNKKG